MLIEEISLDRFRNYPSLHVEPVPGVNILVGDNAQGKSNLLEAIYILATTKSFRTVRDTEVIQSGQSQSRASATVRQSDGSSARIALTLGRSEQKHASINAASTERAVDLLGVLRAVVFAAQDLRLITGEPSCRRRHMDLALAQTSLPYLQDLGAYKRILLQRNKLLKSLRERWSANSGLDAWTSQLVRYGIGLLLHRRDFVQEMSELAGQSHRELSDGAEDLSVHYHPNPSLQADDGPELAKERYEEALQRVAEEELRRGTTLAGPQRDDLRFAINGLEARVYGSQGQQRTVVLSLKLAELDYIEAVSGEEPVLLLDDVMSDLDDQRRRRLLRRLSGRCQTFITCTNLRGFPDEILSQAGLFRVEAGRIERFCL